MKKGISLIVLVITIIVMIIIAGAIIISLNNTDLIKRSNQAVNAANKAEATSIMNVKYAEILAAWYTDHPEQEFTISADNVEELDTYVKEQTGNKWGVVLGSNGVEVQKLDTATNA